VRRFAQDWEGSHLRLMFNNVRRRREWFTENASPRQVANAGLALAQFALKARVLRAWPVLVKIDISPLCNLRCTYCVHARPSSPADKLLTLQSFKAADKMTVGQFDRVVREIGGKSMAVSLYYVGDPLVHPDLAEMCGLASEARLNSHVSTNFSFKLSDDKLAGLVSSGLTHLTICVDGMTQESYERTRVGGRLDLVLDNLRRVLEIRREIGSTRPKIEVQFIKFQHNIAELAEVERWASRHGVDQFTAYWGNLHNYVDLAQGNYRVFGPKEKKQVPLCTWPYFSMQIKYNGDVIPCCYHRHDQQFIPGGDSRVVGNVFDSSVWDVWNSPEYRLIRRLVADPQRVLKEPALGGTFCQGCPTVFTTDADSRTVRAQDQTWESLYSIDKRGIVRRRDAVVRETEAAGADPG